MNLSEKLRKIASKLTPYPSNVPLEIDSNGFLHVTDDSFHKSYKSNLESKISELLDQDIDTRLYLYNPNIEAISKSSAKHKNICRYLIDDSSLSSKIDPLTVYSKTTSASNRRIINSLNKDYIPLVSSHPVPGLYIVSAPMDSSPLRSKNNLRRETGVFIKHSRVSVFGVCLSTLEGNSNILSYSKRNKSIEDHEKFISRLMSTTDPDTWINIMNEYGIILESPIRVKTLEPTFLHKLDLDFKEEVFNYFGVRSGSFSYSGDGFLDVKNGDVFYCDGASYFNDQKVITRNKIVDSFFEKTN